MCVCVCDRCLLSMVSLRTWYIFLVQYAVKGTVQHDVHMYIYGLDGETTWMEVRGK